MPRPPRVEFEGAFYVWSSHRAYLGVEKTAWVDSEVVLRYFGARRPRAIADYVAFVQAGIKQGHRGELCAVQERRFLGQEEFVKEVKHRIGEVPVARAKRRIETWGWSLVVRRVEGAWALRSRMFKVEGGRQLRWRRKRS